MLTPAAAVVAPLATPAKLNFDDAQLALRHKSVSELALAVFTFKLCSMQAFVRNSSRLLSAFMHAIDSLCLVASPCL